MMYDLLIKNGYVVDGRGDPEPFVPWQKADIAIRDKRIAKIGVVNDSEAREIIDANGMIVAPGFIDIHSHSDGYLLDNPKAESKIRQGITTEVIGNCGMSAAPVGGTYRPSKSILPDPKRDWSTMGDYLKELEETGISVNVVPLIGHSNIRGIVMGYENGHPSHDQLARMKEVLEEALDSGAWGMSAGLIYPPGSFSSTEELIELCKVVERHNGVFHIHMRGQGDRLIAATMEALEIAERAGVPLHILHHKGMGDSNAPKIMFTLSLIEEAITRGVNVTLDMYPYPAGQGGLAMFLPLWVHEGGPKALIERLKDHALREKIKREMMEPELVPGYQSYARELGWNDCWGKVLICDCKSEKNKGLIGKSIAEAKPDWQEPVDFVMDLLIEEEGDVPVVIPDFINVGEKYLEIVLRHPITMFGTDGYALAPYGPFGGGVPHPRSYGAFPRILGRYVRQKRLFTWHEAIRKMTTLPARFLGIRDRGEIKEGAYADVVIFDPNSVIDRATFSDPHQYPEGIKYVITNGTIVIRDGEHTGALPGKVLRHDTG